MSFAYAGDVGASSISQIEALAHSSGVSFSVTSTYRPGANDFHGKQNAVDMASSAGNMNKLAEYLYQYSPYLLELIHSDMGAPGGGWFVKNGVRGYKYPADIVSQHYNHVHCAATLSGLSAASTGKLTIPAGTGSSVAAVKKGCLPVTATAVVVTAINIYGGVIWMTH